MLLPIAILLAISEPACHPVLDGERILGQHLAKADGRYAVLPPDAIVGLAPMPGIRRTVPAFTLRKLLEAQGADLTDIAPVCLEWPMRHLKPAELKLAMAATLAIPDLPIEVLDYTVAQVPA